MASSPDEREESAAVIGERRPSMRDVARLAGVSLSSVSLVAAGRPGVGEMTRRRTQEAMRQLGYSPRSRPRHKETRYTLAVISERLVEPLERDVFYAEILEGIQSEAQRHGHLVMLHLLDNRIPEENRRIDALLQEIDGLILANGGDLTDEVIEGIIAHRVPTVLVDNYVVDQPLHCVVADNVTAGYLATRHLLRLGHRRVGLLAGPRKYRSLVDRQEGYLDALTEFGIPVEIDLMPMPPRGEGRKGYRQMLHLLDLHEPPSAVVAISDKTALGALEALKERNLQIPADMALVSIDDIAESAHTTPPLTTVHVPRGEMGAEAVRRLLALLRHEAPRPTKTVLYTHLIVRDSCGAPMP